MLTIIMRGDKFLIEDKQYWSDNDSSQTDHDKYL